MSTYERGYECMKTVRLHVKRWNDRVLTSNDCVCTELVHFVMC